VINGECSYEGIGASCWEDVQRFLFWSHMLSGTAGHSYGTMPISTFSSREDHYRPPSGACSADWEDAIEWSGAAHVGVGRRILERYRWWELEPDSTSIEPHAGPDDWFRPYAATHPDGSVIVYLPGVAQAVPKPPGSEPWGGPPRVLRGLEAGGRYRATYVNPRTGDEEPTRVFTTDDGSWPLSRLGDKGSGIMAGQPTWEDWVLVVRPDRSVSSVSQRPW
jgi:hypothetical protein